MQQASQVLDVRCKLGEGPLWVVDTQMLYWVDILQNQVHKYHPDSKSHETITFEDYICALAPRESGGFLVASRKHLGFWDGLSAKVEPFEEVEADQPRARFNDGAVDPEGNYWIGTMNPPEYKSSLYRMKPDQSIEKVIPNTGISNGIDWSPDSMTMYFTDSQASSIYAFDYDRATATTDNQRVFVKTPHKYAPDGLTVDAEGGVWSAKWDGHKVVRYKPDGEVDLEINVPTRFVTSLTFGGPDLRDLYITTAWNSELNFNEDPVAGNLFHARVDVPGQAPSVFRG